MMTNSERNSQNKNEVPDFNWDRQLEVLLKYFLRTQPSHFIISISGKQEVLKS